MTEPVLTPPSPAEIRGEIEGLLFNNILGPQGGEREELSGKTVIRDYYLVGMLAPRQSKPDPGEFDGQQDDLAVEGPSDAEEVTPDRVATGAPSLFPSSFGFTFGVFGESEAIELEASWGRYERVSTEHDDEEGRPKTLWRRSPGGGKVSLPLAKGGFGPVAPDAHQAEVAISGRVTRNGLDWLVTAFLVNEQEEPAQHKDEAWLFQARLSAADSQGRAVFRRTLSSDIPPEDSSEARALDLAYRDHVEFVVGHGVGVHAEVDLEDPRRAVCVETTAVPSYEVPRTDAPTADDYRGLADVILDMKELAEAEGGELEDRLRPLVQAYRSWIERQRARIGDPPERLTGFEAIAEAVLSACERAADRIEAGISAVADGSRPEVAEAFKFANRAMWMQRIHSMVVERRRANPDLAAADVLADVDLPENRSWRPFQLAFLLLNIPSLSDPTHEERRTAPSGIVDLLWFPTGGGKTEAYLGITAFTLAIRRLRGEIGGFDGRDGVGVLMRYTLRLLTVQQFQRAATLICACERIRQEAEAGGDGRWGSVPFRIGLWVGYSVSPARGSQAARAIDEARGSGWYGGGSSPVQVTQCPWCGAQVTSGSDAEYDEIHKRTLVYCSDPLGRCSFTRRHAAGEGLPLITVDDEIYRFVPGMIIATADKFAQMPWQGPTRALFGRVTRRCERHGYRHPDLDEIIDERDSHRRRGNEPAATTLDVIPLRPPDLIIQDELHLISGPLGSLMGLYEAAVDQLCTWAIDDHEVRPKIIASTATVRRADKQAHQVFWRGLEVFPPPGIDASDSFFAIQRPAEIAPGRRYLGVCAPGRRIKAVEIRLYVALMGAAQRLFDKYGQAADPWMTLVGYFSALRELAGMSRLVDDDVSTRLSQKAITERGLGRRFIRNKDELTSRVDSSDIPRILDLLSLKFDLAEEEPASKGERASKRSGANGQRPLDALLATNMISVGVDVPRLALMVVGGQPKATAEYIQATSRIGRSADGPGLVVTALNWARPRDLSHYETFEHFHATFYRHVEALSVTPFSPRALDRGLSGILAALVRHQSDETNRNPAPSVLNPHSVAVEALEAIRRRAEGVTSDSDVAALVDTAVHQRLDAWLARRAKTSGAVLGYRERLDGQTVGLLEEPAQARWGIWTCPMSLREVEPGVNLLLPDESSS